MRLAELQQRFQAAVLPDVTGPIPAEVTGHFEIYANAYRSRLLEALRDNYPVLHRALGDSSFDEFGLAYIALHPSHFRSIRWFGDGLVKFAAQHPDLLPHPALIDLARLDWALRNAFDSADEELLQISDLVAIAPGDWPALIFRPSASVQLVDLSWQVEPIWQVLSEGADNQTEAPIEYAHGLLVWRQGLDCRWRSLEGAERAALSGLIAGLPFAALCEMVTDAGAADAPALAASFLRQWIDEALLVKG